MKYRGQTLLAPAPIRVLDALLSWSHPYPPSLQELARMLGVTKIAIHQHIVTLQAWGLVEWEPTKKRTLRPTVRFIPADKLG